MPRKLLENFNMAIPRAERLRIIQEVYEKWQAIYGDQDDPEAEAANYDMINEAMKQAEKEWPDSRNA
jgi:hypothetical protein